MQEIQLFQFHFNIIYMHYCFLSLVPFLHFPTPNHFHALDKTTQHLSGQSLRPLPKQATYSAYVYGIYTVSGKKGTPFVKIQNN